MDLFERSTLCENMLRVLMINYEYPPLGGGGANATKNILTYLSKESDIKIDLVTTSSTGRYYTSRINSNVRIFFLPIKKEHIHYWKQKEIIEFLVRATLFTKRLAKIEKYELIHAIFGFPSGAIPFILKNLPYIISLRGSDVPGFNPRFEIQYHFLKPFFIEIWKKAAIITTNSEGLKQLAQMTLNKKRIDVIYNGVNTEKFIHKKEYRRDINQPFNILTVSRIIKRKRIEDLLFAVKMLKENRLNIFLTVIGEGKYKKQLEDLTCLLKISENVQFLGYIPHEILPQYYNKADVFVLPSMNEGMSNTVLEAIASGLPLILTNVGGTTELINGNGFIVDIKAPKHIARAIKNLYNDPDLNKAMGINSRNHAQFFSWKNVAQSYLRLYKKCLKV